VVGRTVTLANALGGPAMPTTHTIVGVMPRGLEFPDAQVQFWTPVPWTPGSGGSLIAHLEDDVSMSAAATERELGDLLFSVVNLGRILDIDPERALAGANLRFDARFRAMEKMSEAEGKPFAGRPVEEMEALWQRVKKRMRDAE
jgi:hypothetical protein